MDASSKIKFLLLLFSLLLVIGLNLAIGSVNIPVRELFEAFFNLSNSDYTYKNIIWEIRLPRIFAAILCGAALSVSGLLMQTFFRNPIAGPYVLGISSGAGLGAAIWIMGSGYLLSIGLIGSNFIFSSWGLVIMSTIGAASILIILLAISWRIPDLGTLLVVGMMIGSAIGALVMLLQFFSAKEELQRFVMWSMGDLGALSWPEIYVFFPVVLISLIAALFLAQNLNVLSIGEENALSLGVSVKKIKWQIILITAILSGSTTAFCGPIAFIGIAVPHLARILFKTNRHQVLLLSTILIGINLMLFCQLIAVLPFNDKILPINVVCSLIAAPIVIWLVLSLRR